MQNNSHHQSAGFIGTVASPEEAQNPSPTKENISLLINAHPNPTS
jgi:hypothetical protein